MSAVVSKVSKLVSTFVESDDRCSLLCPFYLKTIEQRPNRHWCNIFFRAKAGIPPQCSGIWRDKILRIVKKVVNRNAWRLRKTSRLDAELLHARNQGGALDTHAGRGPIRAGYASFGFLEDTENLFAFACIAWSGSCLGVGGVR